MRVSVCMATYNGEFFIAEQLASILVQLGDDDELVIVDDCSKDSTCSIVMSMSDPRIKLFRNHKNMGVVSSFERAISLANGLFIFLSDQDDLWISGRLELMLAELKNSELVSSNFGFMDRNSIRFEVSEYMPLLAKDSSRHFLNLLGILFGRRNYYGCAMAFRRSLVDVILPIPAHVESHDLWIAMAANIRRSVSHLEGNTLVRRIHGQNASVIKRSLLMKFWARLDFIRCIFSLFHNGKFKGLVK